MKIERRQSRILIGLYVSYSITGLISSIFNYGRRATSRTEQCGGKTGILEKDVVRSFGLDTDSRYERRNAKSFRLVEIGGL